MVNFGNDHNFSFSHKNTPLITSSVWVRLAESQNRVAMIITVTSWQPLSLSSVSGTANMVNMKEMNGHLQGMAKLKMHKHFHQTRCDFCLPAWLCMHVRQRNKKTTQGLKETNLT